MRVLELFSGTKSVSKVCKALGYEVISVDINNYKGKFIPTHQVDILKFDYKIYPQDHFDIVWASPPCTYFSSLIRPWIGREKGKKGNKYIYTRELFNADFENGVKWVKKSIEIINYFNPKKWYIENPEMGQLKNQEFMKDLPYTIVDYCCYADWGCRKRTRVWTNVKYTGELCKGKGKCPNMVGNKHKLSMGSHSKDQPAIGSGSNREQKYRIPPELIKQLFLSIN
jgi:hypothetical protein